MNENIVLGISIAVTVIILLTFEKAVAKALLNNIVEKEKRQERIDNEKSSD